MNERTKGAPRTPNAWRRLIYQQLPDVPDRDVAIIGQHVERLSARARLLDDSIVELVGHSLVIVSTRQSSDDE